MNATDHYLIPGHRNWWLAINSSDPDFFGDRHVDVPTAPRGHRLCGRDSYVGAEEQELLFAVAQWPRQTADRAWFSRKAKP